MPDRNQADRNFTPEDRALLIRVEERLLMLKEQLSDIKKAVDVEVAELKKSVEKVHGRIDYERDEVKKNFVTMDKFNPISRSVFAVVGVIVMSVITTAVNFFTKGH